ncbi:MAG TPA: carbohydrate binding domain-containing protein, partial [Polyangia bacterium]
MTYRLFARISRVVRVPSLLVACGLAACASSPPTAPGGPAAAAPAATEPTAPAPAAAAPASANVGTAADWNAPPTNGSPGVDAPKLSGNELLGNTTFDGGKYVPWTTSFTVPGAGDGFVKDGRFCVVVTNKGKDPWDAQMRHREMIIQKGHVYSIKYTAQSTKPIQLKAKVGMSGPPYKEYWADTVDLTTHPQTFVGVFTMEEDEDPTAELAFHFGGPNAGEAQAPYTVCFDDMHLDDPKFVKAKKAEDVPIFAV